MVGPTVLVPPELLHRMETLAVAAAEEKYGPFEDENHVDKPESEWVYPEDFDRFSRRVARGLYAVAMFHTMMESELAGGGCPGCPECDPSFLSPAAGAASTLGVSEKRPHTEMFKELTFPVRHP